MNVKNEKEKEQCEFIVSKRGNVGFDHEFSKSSQTLSTNPKPSPSLVYLYVLGSHFLSLSGDRRKMKEEKQSPRNISYKRVRRQSHNFIDCSFCPTLHWTLPFSYKTKPKTLIPMSYVIIIRLQSQKFLVCIVRSISIWACPFTALFILIYPFYQVLVGNTTSFWGGLEIHNTILLWGR